MKFQINSVDYILSFYNVCPQSDEELFFKEYEDNFKKAEGDGWFLFNTIEASAEFASKILETTDFCYALIEMVVFSLEDPDEVEDTFVIGQIYKCSSEEE